MSIHSAEENDFVMSLGDGSSTYRWTGGRAQCDCHQYQWSDGTAWTFENFFPGEPNGLSARCIMTGFYGTKFDDNYCDRAQPFVCKKEELQLKQQDEAIYQRARTIVISELQNIVYSEFLPTVLGPDSDWMTNLLLPATSNLTGHTSYDSSTNPGIFNEFATVAFRFGHALIPNSLQVSNLPTQRTEDTHGPVKDNFFKTEEFILGTDFSGEAWENVLLGSDQISNKSADSITNFLFCDDCGLDSGFGQDLFARNIQRGRDHGLPGYIKFREICQQSVPSGWNDKPEDISTENWEKMNSVYQNVEDIDPFTGGMAEDPVPGGIVGKTFACIISKQFQNIMEGDRFFFTHKHDGGLGGLPVGLRTMIRKRKLRDIMCDNIRIDELPLNIFDISSEKIKCSENNKINFITASKCLDCTADKSETKDCNTYCPGRHPEY